MYCMFNRGAENNVARVRNVWRGARRVRGVVRAVFVTCGAVRAVFGTCGAARAVLCASYVTGLSLSSVFLSSPPPRPPSLL